jgi:hypothetical protein
MKGRQMTAAELIAQAAANYKRGAHKEQDETRHREKHVKSCAFPLPGNIVLYAKKIGP